MSLEELDIAATALLGRDYIEEYLIKGTIAGAAYDNLGDYTIDTDGKITITFNDTFFTTDGEFIGGIDFSGTASLDNSSESKEIKFTADGKIVCGNILWYINQNRTFSA